MPPWIVIGALAAIFLILRKPPDRFQQTRDILAYGKDVPPEVRDAYFKVKEFDAQGRTSKDPEVKRLKDIVESWASSHGLQT